MSIFIIKVITLKNLFITTSGYNIKNGLYNTVEVLKSELYQSSVLRMFLKNKKRFLKINNNVIVFYFN